MDPSPTFSSAHLRRQREAHRRADQYGRHRHLYLHDILRGLAAALRGAGTEQAVSWLDYGCGKGGFIEEIRTLGLFAPIVGFDPAVAAFEQRPAGGFRLVTCLDVLDVTEERFRANLIGDIAGLTAGVALFDCITRHKPGSTLPSRSWLFWRQHIAAGMTVLDTRTLFASMDGFERILILAAPKDSTIAMKLPML